MRKKKILVRESQIRKLSELIKKAIRKEEKTAPYIQRLQAKYPESAEKWQKFNDLTIAMLTKQMQIASSRGDYKRAWEIGDEIAKIYSK
jgi:excinuclease UvrABC helicase subunit UvrB